MRETATTEVAPRSPWLIAGTVVAVGAALGIASEVAGDLSRPWYFTAQLGAPWLVGSFFVGRMCRGRPAAALAGVGVVGSGLLAVAIHRWWSYGSSYRAGGDLLAWVILAVVAGSILGVAGVEADDGRAWVRAFAWSIPVAVALIESAVAWARWSSAVVAAVDVTIAVVVLAIAARRSSGRHLAMATVITSAALVVLVLVARVLLAGSWGQAIVP